MVKKNLMLKISNSHKSPTATIVEKHQMK